MSSKNISALHSLIVGAFYYKNLPLTRSRDLTMAFAGHLLVGARQGQSQAGKEKVTEARRCRSVLWEAQGFPDEIASIFKVCPSSTQVTADGRF